MIDPCLGGLRVVDTDSQKGYKAAQHQQNVFKLLY